MSIHIADREIFFAECGDESKSDLFKCIFPILRAGFRKILERESHLTNRVMLRERLQTQEVCVLATTADGILDRDGFTDHLLDQMLHDTRSAFMECICRAEAALDVEIATKTTELADAMDAFAEREVMHRLFDSMDPVVVEIYRQWLMNGYSYKDLVFVTKDRN